MLTPQEAARLDICEWRTNFALTAAQAARAGTFTNGLSVLVNGVQVASLEAQASDFMAFGVHPATVGSVRLPNGPNETAGIVARDSTNATDVGLMSLDSGNNLFFNTIGVLTSIQLGQTPTFFWNLLNGCTFGQGTRPTDTTVANLLIRAQSAFASASVFINGGSLILESGDAQSNGVNGLRGAVQLNLSHTVAQIGFEVAEVALGRRVTALNGFSTGVTSTNVPTGDKVTFLGTAATNPSSNPSGGCIIYCPNASSAFAYFTGGGFQFTFPTQTSASATGGAATLPANPVGFWQGTQAGTTYKIPYYAA